MRKIRIGDAVSTPGGRHGVVRGFPDKRTAKVLLYNENGRPDAPKLFSLDEIAYVKPLSVTTKSLRAYYRFEIPLEDIAPGSNPLAGYKVSEPCYVTLDDAMRALFNMRDCALDAASFARWVDPYAKKSQLRDAIVFISEREHERALERKGELPPHSEADMLYLLRTCYNDIVYAVTTGEIAGNDTSFLDYDRILSDCHNFRSGKGDRVKPYLWSRAARTAYVMGLTDAQLANMDKLHHEEYRRILEELCMEGHAGAMERKAYSCYGGSPAYECDWVTARDLLLELMDRKDISDEKKRFFANTLGYLFYYGRCNDGVPQYDLAFRYYCIGFFGMVRESAYKLADMYMNGKGVPENHLAAYNLLTWAFSRNMEDFTSGNPDNNFADAALRMSNAYRDGLHVAQDRFHAYELITQAACALRERARNGSHYGDAIVAANIDYELAELRMEFPDAAPTKFLKSRHPDHLLQTFENGYVVNVVIERTKKGIALTAKRIPKADEERAHFVLVTHPCHGYCKLHATIEEEGRDIRFLQLREGSHFHADALRPCGKKNGAPCYEFLHEGRVIARIACKSYRFRVDWKGAWNARRHTFARVEFTRGGKTYDYLCDGLPATKGCLVVVEVNGVEKIARVVDLISCTNNEMMLDAASYRHVERLAVGGH